MFNHPKLRMTLEPHEIEQGAVKQIAQVLGIDVLEKLCVFSDVHQGYDIPIGSAALIDGYIWPGAVGVDINCGMCHIDTGKTVDELGITNMDSRWALLRNIQRTVPTNYFDTGKDTPFKTFPNCTGDKALKDLITPKIGKQLATLGGGNHFLSIGVNSKGNVSVTLHTGSRYAGNQIGKYWMKLAKEKGKNFNGLFLLPFESELGEAYYTDMLWAFDYADRNRELILSAVLKIMGLDINSYRKTMINETHNHAIDMGDGTILHRKGATPAEEGVLGIIPANMRDGVFVTEGLGNEDFLCSTSHGAGRCLARAAATRQVKIENVRAEMERLGIVVDLKDGNADEAPEVYKDIKHVLDSQQHVVTVVDHFKPIIVHIG